MDLKRVREHDQNHNHGLAEGARYGRRVLCHDVSANLVSKGQVARDGDEDIDEARGAVGRAEHRGGAEVRIVRNLVEDTEHVLVARVGEDDDGEGGERGHDAGPFEDAQGRLVVSVGEGVVFREVVDHQDDQVPDGDQGDDRGVLERVQPAQEGEGDDDQHEGGDPKVPVEHERTQAVLVGEPANHPRHQVPDDDQVADPDAEALDGDGGVKDDRRVGVRDLRQGEEAGRPPFEVAGAPRLEVQPEPCRHPGPYYDDRPQQYTHVRHGQGHREHAGPDDGVEEVDDGGDP